METRSGVGAITALLREGKMTKGVLVPLVWVFLVTSAAYSQPQVPFTREDRDRLIRLEEGQKALNQRIDGVEKRMESLERSVNLRIDDLRGEVRDLKTFMLWGFGILFGGMGLLIGFVIWDRRTALAPAVRKTQELEEREEKLEKAFKELARRDSAVAEILRQVGLL